MIQNTALLVKLRDTKYIHASQTYLSGGHGKYYHLKSPILVFILTQFTERFLDLILFMATP